MYLIEVEVRVDEERGNLKRARLVYSCLSCSTAPLLNPRPCVVLDHR